MTRIVLSVLFALAAGIAFKLGNDVAFYVALALLAIVNIELLATFLFASVAFLLGEIAVEVYKASKGMPSKGGTVQNTVKVLMDLVRKIQSYVNKPIRISNVDKQSPLNRR